MNSRPTSRFHRQTEIRDDVVTGYRISATLDLSTCLKCAALDDRIFPPGIGPRPPFHEKCRCVAIPVSKTWRGLGIDLPEFPTGSRASMYGQVPGEWKYFDWLARRHAYEVERVLGPRLAKVFLAGGLTPQQFSDALLTPRYRVKSIKELQQELPEAFQLAGLR